MRVFEFHFNPGEKEDLIFNSFCYEPENVYEKRMGGIFMLGELKNALPHNFRLLDKIAASVKKEFYSKFNRTHEQSLREAIKKGNDFLAGEVSRDNTDWLGNLSFAIISLKNFELNFTKIGQVKLFLLRSPHVIDIGSKLDNQEIEPYPLKIFNNIVSGKLGENDAVLASTEGIFPALKSAINEIAKISSAPLNEKILRELVETKEKELTSLNGSFILISAVNLPAQQKPKVIFKRELEKLSIP